MIDASGEHTPVLLEEVVRYLDVRPGDVVLDATLGYAGHARRLAEAAGPSGTLIGLDLDPVALRAAESVLAGAACTTVLKQASFAKSGRILSELGVSGVDALLADLGVNSAQLTDVARGFSFQEEGPLDMRLDPSGFTTAADLVNRLSEKELGDLLYFNAQETGSRKIARRIHEARRSGRITTTSRLARIVCEALGVDPHSRKSKVHPATRTFLALRMAVNDEMGALDRLLEDAPALLKPGGRIAVISFHSTEDRRVKRDFLRRRGEGLYEIVTKKPVVAGEDERIRNPRSRSAKLRVARRYAGDSIIPQAPWQVEDGEAELDSVMGQ